MDDSTKPINTASSASSSGLTCGNDIKNNNVCNGIQHEVSDRPSPEQFHHTTANNLASMWLIAWTCNNIGVTLLNKAAFSKVDFRYPYFLSAMHMALNAIGSQFVFWNLERQHDEEIDANSKALPELDKDSWVTKLFGNLQRKKLDKKGQWLMMFFSVIFSANIAIGNVSLQHVSVNFNQVMRSLVPAITIVMGFALGKPTSWNRQLAVLPVMIGVAMACFGDMSYTALGFTYTILCIFLAAIKVVASGELLTGSHKMHPFDLLARMAPLSFLQCMVLSTFTGEVSSIAARWHNELNPMVNLYPSLVVFMSAVLSFTFNISSLQTNKLTSPLTLCIAGNVKQVLMIVIATVVFETEISFLNAAGICVVLMGSACYSYVSLLEQTKSRTRKATEPKTIEIEKDYDLTLLEATMKQSNLVSVTPPRSVARMESASC